MRTKNASYGVQDITNNMRRDLEDSEDCKHFEDLEYFKHLERQSLSVHIDCRAQEFARYEGLAGSQSYSV